MRKIIIASLIVAASVSTGSAYAQASKAFVGQRLFNSYCFLCHGVNGKGKGPLAKRIGGVGNVTSQKASDLNDRQLFLLIQGTAPHGESESMPKWGRVLSDPDIDALVAYVRFLQRSKFPLMGDPEVGKAIYDRYCSVCHGMSGRGDGPMTAVMPIQPADHTTSLLVERLNNNELMDYISKGGGGDSYMPGWKGTLSQDELAGVVSYIRLLSYTK